MSLADISEVFNDDENRSFDNTLDIYRDMDRDGGDVFVGLSF